MTEAFRMLLEKMNPHAGHILVVGRGDSKVLVLGTANAANRLSLVNQASPLELDVVARETEHYRAIEADLLTRFRGYMDDGYGHWLQAEHRDVVAALDDYDLATGARIRSGDLTIGDRAFIPGIGKGEVTGFMTREVGMRIGLETPERVIIFSEDAGKFINAPRRQVKRVVRIHA